MASVKYFFINPLSFANEAIPFLQKNPAIETIAFPWPTLAMKFENYQSVRAMFVATDFIANTNDSYKI